MTATESAARSNSCRSWVVASGRVKGTSHERLGTACQDDGRWLLVKDRAPCIIAVSDGAGSGRLSQYASAVAVRATCHYLASHCAEGQKITLELLTRAAQRAIDEILKLFELFRSANYPKLKLSDLNCTLLLTAIDDSKLYMLQVGDGAIVVRMGEELSCLSPQSAFEYANETFFLVNPAALDRACKREVDASSLTSVAVMSDGVQRVAVSHRSNEPFDGFFNPLFSFLETASDSAQEERDATVKRILSSDDINARTDDDKTLIVAASQSRQESR